MFALKGIYALNVDLMMGPHLFSTAGYDRTAAVAARVLNPSWTSRMQPSAKTIPPFGRP